MSIYFGFALSSSMFPEDCTIQRTEVIPEYVQRKAKRGDLIACLNPSHVATIAAMKERFGIDIPIPESPPKVVLDIGDSMIVMEVSGLPRLTDRHEYTAEEIGKVNFKFVLFYVKS